MYKTYDSVLKVGLDFVSSLANNGHFQLKKKKKWCYGMFELAYRPQFVLQSGGNLLTVLINSGLTY